MAATKPWYKTDKFFDVARATSLVLLTAICGATISHCYQIKDEEKKVFANAREGATETCYRIINLMGKRHYGGLRAAIGFRWGVDQEKRWAKYDETVEEWNQKRYETLALANRYFGQETEQKIYDIIKSFNMIHRQLITAKNTFHANQPQDNLNLEKLLDDIYSLDDDISSFSKDLQQRLKEGKVDIYSPKPPITKPLGQTIKH